MIQQIDTDRKMIDRQTDEKYIQTYRYRRIDRQMIDRDRQTNDRQIDRQADIDERQTEIEIDE